MEDVEDYWNHSRTVQEPWAINHPASSRHIPLGLHGDAARLWTQYKFEKLVGVFLNIVHWRPRSVRHSRFLLFSIPYEKLYKNRTMNHVFGALASNLNSCFEGLDPWTGLQLTRGNQKFAVTELRGDWEWHVQVWRPTASWQALKVCFKCPAISMVSGGDPKYLYHNTGTSEEGECGWIREEFSLNAFVARRLKDRNLCNSGQISHVIFLCHFTRLFFIFRID